MTLRGCGFHDDPREIVSAQLVAYHARDLVGAASSSLPREFSWRAHVPGVANQGSTNSCVGQAFASSLELRSILMGSPIRRPSAKAIYDLARMERNRTAPLFDGGCGPQDAINGIKLSGIVAEERWPLTAENVNVKPEWDVFQHGLAATIGQHYRIQDGNGAAQLLREAVHQRYLPVFAMDVYENFQDYDGSGVYRATGGRFVGRHMQVVVGWGDDYLEVLNSWGDEWGDGGFSRISESFIQSKAAGSFIVLTQHAVTT